MVEPTTATRSTYEDCQKTPDDERWELLNGELIMPAAPGVNHRRIVGSLFTQISAFVSQSALGEVLLAPCDVVLSEENVVQPDLLFVSSSRGHIITHENVCGSPDLVVDVLSPASASRDWREKMDAHAEHGMREYWIVDPDAGRIWVMTLSDARRFNEDGNYGVDDAPRSVVLEGIDLDLTSVFQPKT